MLKEKQESTKKISKNKKIWKWTIWNLVLIIITTSVIINITYLPKYFTLKNHTDHTLNIDIAVYNNSYDSETNSLFLLHYQSTMATVGDLMASYPDTYHLKSTSWGRILAGIYNDSEKKWIEPDFTSYFWEIYYNGKEAPVGIDSLKLHMNDKIDLYYQTITFE